MTKRTSGKNIPNKKSRSGDRPDYREMSDEELIERMHERSVEYPEIVNFLIAKYSDYVRYLYSVMNIHSPDKDDIIQEGIIGIYDAIEKYDPSKGASFKTYVTFEIRGNILNAAASRNKLSSLPLKDYVPSDQNLFSLPSSDMTPEEKAILDELIGRLYHLMENELSETERRSLLLRLSGNSVKEIARSMNISEKSAENAILRARTKLKTSIKKESL